jgi:hypothetical protein
MSERRRIRTVVLVVTSFWMLLHLYVGRRLFAHGTVPAPWSALAWTGLILLALGPVVAFWAGRSGRGRPAEQLRAKRVAVDRLRLGG